MSVLTTRPNVTDTGGGADTEPSGTTAVAALSDSLDTTYVVFTHNDHPFFRFAEPTIPAGAVVKAGRLRARLRKSTSSGEPLVFTWRMQDPDSGSNIYNLVKDKPIPSTTFTTITVLEDAKAGSVHVAPTDIRVDMYAHGAGDSPSASISALYFDTIYVAKPVADVISPTGTITGDTTPTVSWQNTLDPDGGPQKYFQVKTSTSSSPASAAIEDSGEVASGVVNWEPTTAISDGTRYAHVRVAQVVNGVKHWSDWDSQSFTVSIARPGVPTLTLTAESASGRIKVDLDDNAGSATTTLFHTQVSNDGTTWMDLRTDEGDGLSTPTGGLATEYDYEAPIGGTRSFRTRALHAYAEGYAVSAWSSTATSSWTSTVWWVKPLGTPTLSMAVSVRSQPTTTRAGRVGYFQPLEAKYPIAVIDKRSSASGQIVFRFANATDRDAFEDLADDSSVVLIQAPSGTVDWPDRYCALGDYERERVIDNAGSIFPYTFDSVQWTEVSRP
jgi:hypothetical protein